jgi:hypothetical protein
VCLADCVTRIGLTNVEVEMDQVIQITSTFGYELKSRFLHSIALELNVSLVLMIGIIARAWFLEFGGHQFHQGVYLC